MDINKHQDLLTINWNLIFSIITVLVLILILKHFFFEKVKKFMDERKAKVEEQFQKAEEAENQARKKLDEYNEILAGAEKEKRVIIADAMENAKLQANSVLDEARKEAADIREKSRLQIEREKIAARKEIHNEVGDLAVQLAEKILESELDEDAQASVIDEIISKSEANRETKK
ncbi:ATP synthase F0, B subunit [Eubacterium infirmum F0142]|nr:ATP synthase F0, B subunit [Eubacterium infirmum F0142]